MIELLVLFLSVYGASKLLTEYDGFGDVFYKLRNKPWLKMLSCIICTSVWVAVLFSIIWALGFVYLLTPVAVVGAVILLEEKL